MGELRVHQPIEELDLFKLYEEVSDWAYEIVSKWQPFARRTIGEQLVTSADSICAYLVEGDGRYGTADALRFFIIARSSARECRLWIRRAAKRKLVETSVAAGQIEKLERATKLLNLLIKYRREKEPLKVREPSANYVESHHDEFCAPL